MPVSLSAVEGDPIFGADGGLAFNWAYANNGVRIAVSGAYTINPYNLETSNNQDSIIFTIIIL